MTQQKKRVSFADEEAPATKEEKASLVHSDKEDAQAAERIEDLERQLKS